MARKKNLRNKNSDIKVVPDKEKESILSKLYHNKLLRSKVDNALDEDMSYDDIIELCKEYDLELSKSAITRYKSKRKEAIENGWDLGELIDKRKKNKCKRYKRKRNSYIRRRATFSIWAIKTSYTDDLWWYTSTRYDYI